jgi:hypothetical protein
MKWVVRGAFLKFALLCFSISVGATKGQNAADWRVVEPGMEIRWLMSEGQYGGSDSLIFLVRIDPAKWKLTYVGLANTRDSTAQTARRWAKAHGLVAAINAGMFTTDYRTPVGYVEYQGRVLSGKVNGYQSISAFDPRDRRKGPLFRIFDLDQEGVTIGSVRRDYASLVQNLRLVKKPGENRWQQQEKKWSEAALGEDVRGNILFVFCRTPITMHDLNGELLSAKIGLVALQHLEGGPQAQLFLHTGDIDLEMFGSHSTSNGGEGVGATIEWPIPNVLGIKMRMAAR